MQKSRAAVLESPRRISIQEFNIPQIGPNDGLLKVEMAGVCGSDPKFYHGLSQINTPIILGHEILGHIEEVGEQAAQRWRVKKGDRVIVEANIRCGNCYYCLTGNYHLCQRGMGFGTRLSTQVTPSLWGAYSEYMYLHSEAEVHKISEGVPAEAAVLTSAVIANGIQWVRLLAGATIGDCVVIQGAGQQGISATVAARESGATPVIVTGLSRDSQRLALCREFGAHHTINVEKEDVTAKVSEITGGRMADVVVDVTGSPQALQKSLDLVRPKGTILAAGLTGSETLTPLLIDKIVHKEIRLQGARSKGAAAVLSAIKLVEARKYPWERIVSHHYPLEKAEEALQAVGGDLKDIYPTKAVIVPHAIIK